MSPCSRTSVASRQARSDSPAERLEHSVREEDTVARIGGDEFVIILSGLTKATNASPIAEKILREIGRPVALDFETLVPSGSVGISVFPDDGQSLENLLAAADAAMYNAKRNPARAFAFYTPDITAR
jgi:diguanylate cyclase (GGDEF)-like protein